MGLAGRRARPTPPPTPTVGRSTLVGLRLPVRATVAIAVVTFALLFDYSRTFIPDDIAALGPSTGALAWATRSSASCCSGSCRCLVVVLGFRDRPSRYGLTLGDWRAGSCSMLAGCAVMTPIVLWFATLPDVRAYYAPSAAPLARARSRTRLELTAAEFAVPRLPDARRSSASSGRSGVVVAALPFVFGHLGKPELELFSTLGGGLVYGWLAWRTRSIVWGAIGHTYILTLVTVAAPPDGRGSAASTALTTSDSSSTSMP